MSGNAPSSSGFTGFSLPVPELSSVVAGFFSGAAGTCVGHPLDTVKVRVQLGLSAMGSSSEPPRSLSAAIDAAAPVSRAGLGGATGTSPGALSLLTTLRSLYRGLLPPLLTSGVLNSVNFAAYEGNRTYLQRHHGLDRNSPINVFLASAGAGSLISTVSSPISLVKVQRQSNVCAQGDPRSYYSMMQEIRNKRGLSGFYRGYLPVLYMESVGRGLYMYTYFTCKPLFAGAIYGDKTCGESLSMRALSAAVAGCTSWVIVYPVDVVKAKLQADVNKERFKGVADCIQKTFNEGGMRAFWRGIGYTLLRAAPTAATVLPVYEATKDFLANNYDF